MKKKLLACAIFILLAFTAIYRDVYSLDAGNKPKEGVFETIYKETAVKEGVREITYGQFIRIRNSADKYILLDARSAEGYNKGHIDGAISFPDAAINEQSAKNKLEKSSKIIVYCASFSCHASTAAARMLSKLGYKVVDYKGGIKEWQEKGNKPVK